MINVVQYDVLNAAFQKEFDCGLNINHIPLSKNRQIGNISINKKEIEHLRKYYNLNTRERSFLYSLSEFIGWETNILTNENGFAVNQQTISKYLDIDRKSVGRLVRSLEEKRLIYVVKIERCKFYILNPYVMSFGNNINIFTFKLFDKIGYKSSIDSNVDDCKKINAFSFSTEIKLEKYLIKNIEKVEEGMKFVDRQVKVEGGTIDILAKDNKGVLCVIELKVKDNDYRIVRQCVDYPKHFLEHVRMITIAPDYTQNIREKLNELKYVEMKTYNTTNDSLSIK